MEASRPAYFDLLTLHLPRYLVRCHEGTIPTTNQEAVVELGRIKSPLSHISRGTLEQFGKLDIDAILRQVPLSVFADTRGLVEELLAPPRGEPR